MFNKDFFPTPAPVIAEMLDQETLQDKVVLEPSAGKGDIVDYLTTHRAQKVLACETNPDLRKILSSKCDLIGDDFLKLTADKISHIDYIVMNPPFSADEKHILHAWEIAPAGCKIITLCNLGTIGNLHTKLRAKLKTIIDEFGSHQDLGDCFSDAERKTDVKIALIKLLKPGKNNDNEFEGFFMEEDPAEKQENGIMSYNVIRDIVQRYVQAIKIFDKELELAQEMDRVAGQFFKSKLAVTISENGVPKTRNDFKKELQKSGWQFIFDKMNMAKYATKGLREDINTFVEKQHQIPFTMRNIYRMLEIVAGTTGQRMDKALLEVFDRVTKHYDENRFNVEGWKTNSHYLLNKRFIIPGCVSEGSGGEIARSTWSYNSFELVEDLMKALCFLDGKSYSNFISLDKFLFYKYKLVDGHGNYLNDRAYEHDVKIVAHGYELESIDREQKKYHGSKVVSHDIKFGQWFDWAFFRVRAYKKGTLHIEFKDDQLWGRFNQRIAELKGYPLYESVKKKAKSKTMEVALKETLA